MARRLVQYIEFTDDFDKNQPAEDTLEIAYDGMVYEIDCSAEQAKECREYLAQFAEVAHDRWKMPARPGNRKRVTVQKALTEGVTSVPKPEAGARQADLLRDRSARREIREWAEANGHPCPRTGKIPRDTLRAYVDNNPDAYVPETTLNEAGMELPNVS